MELLFKNWYNKFLTELRRAEKVRIISPFISEQVVRKMDEHFNFINFELITRFNLQDFASNVSSLEGLRFAVEKQASVYGIKSLHSKIYLFDERSAIVTSANLTNGGLTNNYECGILFSDGDAIQELHRYFNSLKQTAAKLTLELCEQWQQQLSVIEPVDSNFHFLPDYGTSGIKIDPNRNYYIKFLGTSRERVPLNYSTKEVVLESLCHYACGFSKNKKPRQIRDGDIIYIARMINNPNDYAIFGRAEAIGFQDGRDQATDLEILERPWKAKWPIYLRLRNCIFINGQLSDGILLQNLVRTFYYGSFVSTLRRFRNGERNINPNRSLSQQAYVGLTTVAAEWLESRFQDALERVGKIEDNFINELPQSYIE